MRRALCDLTWPIEDPALWVWTTFSMQKLYIDPPIQSRPCCAGARRPLEHTPRNHPQPGCFTKLAKECTLLLCYLKNHLLQGWWLKQEH